MNSIKVAALAAVLAAAAHGQEAAGRFVRGDNDIAAGMGRQPNVHAHTNIGYENGLVRAAYSGINELSPGEFRGREAFTFGSQRLRWADGVFATRVGEDAGSAYGLRLTVPQRLKVTGYVDVLKRAGGGSEAFLDLGKEYKGWGAQSWTTISGRPSLEAEVRTPTIKRTGKVSWRGFGHAEFPENRYAFGLKGEF